MDHDLERLQAALPRRYTLIEEIDRGGLARVYRAREELPERDVVIKVLDQNISARLGRDRFVHEVEVTSRLVHPHIVPVYSAGEAGGMLYYVMPYIDGESLRDRLEREGPLPIDEALRIASEVAGALQHAHNHEIVHRDVKPANIMLQGGHAVVADFGIARALRAAEGGSEFTHEGIPLGTPDYMSPEQGGADQLIDGRTDTYALACVVYEMLAGEPPFHSRSAQATLARHRTDQMPSLRTLRESVPRGVELVIAQALAKAPADRQSRISHFADALLVANSTRTEATPPKAPEPAPAPRGNWMRFAGAAALVAIALGVVGSYFGPGPLAIMADETSTSVAVVPFENRTSDPTFDQLGLSLADEIINHLQRTTPEVQVIDTYTALSLWRENLGTPRLMDSLQVEHLVHGYIERGPDGLVVYVSESDEGGRLSPRRSYTLSPDNLNVELGALARRLALSFLAQVGMEDDADLAGTLIGPGREPYLLGNALLGQRTPGAMREAIGFFREALTLEPSSAPAHAALSSAYALSVYYKYDVGLTGYELAAASLAAADAAIEYDSEFANGYSARGFIRALIGIDIDAAEADFDRARELAPNAPNGPSWSARILAQKGQVDEAFAEARRARDLDPLQAGRHTALASLGFQLGDYDVVIEEAREAYRLEEQLLNAKAFEGRALAVVGRADECLRIDFGVYRLVRAICLHSAGRVTEARTLADEAAETLLASGLDDAEYREELVAQDLASYYAYAGDATEAARWLRFAFDRSPAGVDDRLLGSELFSGVRDAAAFSNALDEVRASAERRVRDERARLDARP